MKTETLSKSNWLTAGGLLLALPTGYFIFIALLKYGLGINAPFDSAQPFLERIGIKESMGWNVNLLIVFGPFIALFISLFQVLAVEWNFNKEKITLHFTFQKKWFPLVVAVLSAGLLATLFFYMLGENCRY
jgi:hypothetical protein